MLRITSMRGAQSAGLATFSHGVQPPPLLTSARAHEALRSASPSRPALHQRPHPFTPSHTLTPDQARAATQGGARVSSMASGPTCRACSYGARAASSATGGENPCYDRPRCTRATRASLPRRSRRSMGRTRTSGRLPRRSGCGASTHARVRHPSHPPSPSPHPSSSPPLTVLLFPPLSPHNPYLSRPPPSPPSLASLPSPTLLPSPPPHSHPTKART